MEETTVSVHSNNYKIENIIGRHIIETGCNFNQTTAVKHALIVDKAKFAISKSPSSNLGGGTTYLSGIVAVLGGLLRSQQKYLVDTPKANNVHMSFNMDCSHLFSASDRILLSGNE